MWKHFEVIKEETYTHNPVLVIALSTSNPQYILLYSQARELASYLLSKVKFEKIASLYSSALSPAIEISKDGSIDLAGVHLYHHYNGRRDVILVAGHSSPMGDEYEFSDALLSFAKTIGIKELVSIGARWSEEPVSAVDFPKVIGFSSDEDGVEELKALEVEIQKEESAYFFSNTIVALAPKYSIRGLKLSVNHGEPRPHPKSLISLFKVLSKIMREDIEVGDLEKTSKELEQAIRVASGTQDQVMGTMQQGDIYR